MTNLSIAFTADSSKLEAGIAGAGVPVLIEHLSGIAHNKVMVLDRETIITGSFNFTRSAQVRNAENLVVIHDPELAAAYAANWRRNANLSTPFASR